MDIKQLKKDWQNEKINAFFEKQLQVPIICTLVVGSHLLKLNTEQSDIDIILITTNKINNNRLPYSFKYNGIVIHGWVNSIWSILTSMTQDFGFGAIADYLLTEDFILDCKSNYSDFKNFILKNKELISKANYFFTVEKEELNLFKIYSKDEIILFKSLYTILIWWKDHKDSNFSIDLIKRVKTRKILPEDKPIIIKTAKLIWEDHLNSEYSIAVNELIKIKNDFYKEMSLKNKI